MDDILPLKDEKANNGKNIKTTMAWPMLKIFDDKRKFVDEERLENQCWHEAPSRNILDGLYIKEAGCSIQLTELRTYFL